MRAQSHDSGLRLLRASIARLLRGVMGQCVEIWRTRMRDEEREAALEGQRAALEARAVEMSVGAGLRQLRQILVRLVKGEVGLRVEVWRMAVRMWVMEQHKAMQVRLEAQMRGQSHDSGLRLLRASLGC